MTENYLERLFAHNHWANQQIIEACSNLDARLLDADPKSATRGSIRITLWHLVAAQQNYLSLLTGSVPRSSWQAAPDFDQLQKAATMTGEGLIALAREEQAEALKEKLQTRDGDLVSPWVVIVQAINHATEHREQIKSMLSSLGVTPPNIDGWAYGEAAGAITPKPT